MQTLVKLADQSCRPIPAGTAPMAKGEAQELMHELPQWTVGQETVEREFRFKDFREAMDFVNQVAAVANREDHHPDLSISYNKVRITLTTHKIKGLSMNDLIVAAKIDRLV